jgi:putative holliday junction resolvase
VNRAAPAATLLAFDFGTRRIGVAIGNTVTRGASALTTIDTPDEGSRIAAIAALIGEWTPALLVVGMPVHADGSEHAMTRRARAFARMLERRFKLPVCGVDERYTTEMAQAALERSPLPRAQHRAVRDQVAAQIILQSYFDEMRDDNRDDRHDEHGDVSRPA